MSYDPYISDQQSIDAWTNAFGPLLKDHPEIIVASKIIGTLMPNKIGDEKRQLAGEIADFARHNSEKNISRMLKSYTSGSGTCGRGFGWTDWGAQNEAREERNNEKQRKIFEQQKLLQAIKEQEMYGNGSRKRGKRGANVAAWLQGKRGGSIGDWFKHAGNTLVHVGTLGMYDPEKENKIAIEKKRLDDEEAAADAKIAAQAAQILEAKKARATAKHPVPMDERGGAGFNLGDNIKSENDWKKSKQIYPSPGPRGCGFSDDWQQFKQSHPRPGYGGSGAKSAWAQHVAKVHKHSGRSFKESLRLASQSYRK